MRQFVLTSAIALAALGFVALDATPAHAQVIVNGGYSQGFYGYSPGYYGGGVIVQSGGMGGYYSNNYGYAAYPSYGYSSYPSYGYSSYPTYNSNYSPSLGAYYNFYRRGAVGNSYNYGRRYR